MRKINLKPTIAYMFTALFSSLIVTILYLYYKVNILALLSGVPVVLVGAGTAWVNQIVLVGIGFEKSNICGFACLFIPFASIALFDEQQWEKAY